MGIAEQKASRQSGLGTGRHFQARFASGFEFFLLPSRMHSPPRRYPTREARPQGR
jgi:hypothetical protein